MDRSQCNNRIEAKSPTQLQKCILTGVMFIVVGVVLNVAVAWTCASWSHLPQGALDSLEAIDIESDREVFTAMASPWSQNRPAHFPSQPDLLIPYQSGFGVQMTELVAWSGPYPTVEEVESTPGDEVEWPRSYEQRIITAGWPLPSMQMSVWDETVTEGEAVNEFDQITGGIAIGGNFDELQLLPLMPLAAGMLLGTVFWGGLCYLGFRGFISLRCT